MAADVTAYVEILNQQKIIAKIISATYFASGVDADIFKLIDAAGGVFALKKSRDNFFDNANDINQNDAQLFRQEALLANLINAKNIKLKCPQIIFCHDDFLLMEFCPDDGASIDHKIISHRLGQLHKATQNVKLPFLPISHEGHDDVAHALADRMMRRIKNLKQFINIDFSWLSRPMIVDIVQNDANEKCLLHMDFRRNNLLHQADNIYVIDWANALIGSPLLEIARLEIYGEQNAALCTSYLTQNPHIIFTQKIYNIYQLDTAIMMNLVFLSSAPNKQMASLFEKKLRNLIQYFL